MTRTSLFIDDMDFIELKNRANAENKSSGEIIRDAVKEYLYGNKKGGMPSFANIGKSSRRDISEKYRAELWKK